MEETGTVVSVIQGNGTAADSANSVATIVSVQEREWLCRPGF
jgi:hypothetical protein